MTRQHLNAIAPAPRPLSSNCLPIHRARFLLLLLALVSTPAAHAADASNSPNPSRPGNRYLLLVETSRAMQRRTNAVVKSAYDLLASGMKGQFRPGDTLGVWTFNQSVYTGRLPLQHIEAGNRKEVAERVANFLRAQKFEKSPTLRELLPMVNHLIEASPSITIILFSSGENRVEGTPYDASINETFSQWRQKQIRANRPFVTILRGAEGSFTDSAVYPIPSEVAFSSPSESSAAPPAPVPKMAATPKPAGRVLAQALAEEDSRFSELPPEPSLSRGQPSELPEAEGVSTSVEVLAKSIPEETIASPATIGSAPVVPEPTPELELEKEAPPAEPPATVTPELSPPVAQPSLITTFAAPPKGKITIVQPNGKTEVTSVVPEPVPSIPAPVIAAQPSTPAIASPQPAPAPSPLPEPPPVAITAPSPEPAPLIVRAREARRSSDLAAEVQKVASLPELPPPPAPRQSSFIFGAAFLMTAGFGCAGAAALGLVYVGVVRRKRPASTASIVTRSLHRQRLH